jgi:hypothetical protein
VVRNPATGQTITIEDGVISFTGPGITTAGFLSDLGGTMQMFSAMVGAGDLSAGLILQSKNESDDGLAPELVIPERVQLQDPFGNPGVIRVSDPAVPNQDESWHSLGALGAHYAVGIGRYKLSVENELMLDIKVTGDGLQATAVPFAVTLPAAYRPQITHDTLPMGTSRQVTAGDIWPRLAVSSAGVVTVTNQGTANAFAFCGRIPLEA